jgi:hypothetical protein
MQTNNTNTSNRDILKQILKLIEGFDVLFEKQNKIV